MVRAGETGEEVGDAALKSRVAPVGGDFGQGGEDEVAEMGARVGQDRVWGVADQGADGDDVEVQGAGGVGYAAVPPGGGLDRLEAGEQPGGIGRTVEAGDAVAVIGLAGRRVGGGYVPARDGGKREAGQAAQRLNRGAAGGQGKVTLGAWQVCADGDQYHNNVYPGPISS